MAKLKVTLVNGFAFEVDAEERMGSMRPAKKAHERSQNGVMVGSGERFVFYPPHRIAAVEYAKGS